LEDKKRQGRKSIRSTEEHLAAIAWAYSGRHLSELPAVAIDVVNEGLENGRAPATVKQRLAWLKAAARWCWKMHDMAEHDPTAKMQLPEVDNERQVYVSRGEMLAIAWASRSHAVRILLRVSFYSGLRLGELATVEVVNGMLYLPMTKNGERRCVPAHPRIRTCLDYLPLSMPRSTLHKYLKAAREQCGLEQATFHTMRHSAASEMINAKVDLYTVGQVLGHKDPRSTQRYAHLAAGTLAAAVGKIGQKNPHKQGEAGTRTAGRRKPNFTGGGVSLELTRLSFCPIPCNSEKYRECPASRHVPWRSLPGRH
jgi:integrase